MKKIVSVFLCLAALCSLFVCCSTEKKYRDDTDPAALIQNAERKIVLNENLSAVERSGIALKLTPGLSDAVKLSDEYLIKDTAGESFDEYGILHIEKKEDLTAAFDGIKTYLENEQKSMADSTLPDGKKSCEWEIRIFGNYIAFTMLTEENRTAFFLEIEQLLLEV